MGKENTGLSNTPASESEIAANRDLEQPRAEEDSDSELEETGPWGGYMPLAQNSADSEALYGPSNDSEDGESTDEEDRTMRAAGTSSVNVAEFKESSTAIVEEIWSQPAPKEVDIEMSDKKIDLVKQMMLNIQLPAEAIPAWAQNVPEAQWKEHLLQKLNQQHH